MKPNSKIIEFKSFFNSEYRKRKGFEYGFSHGKDEKSIETCIKYFEHQYGEKGLPTMKECVGYYLDSDEEFIVQTAHDLGLFCSVPHRWLSLLSKNRTEAKQREVIQEKVKVNQGWYDKQLEKSLKDSTPRDEDVRGQIKENPKLFMRGFKNYAPMIKKVSPSLYSKWREIILSELGKDEAVKLWKELDDGIQ